MKNVLLTTLLVLGVTSAWALQQTSLRIKAMGENLQGIVEDEYTDMLANPARMVGINKNTVFANTTAEVLTEEGIKKSKIYGNPSLPVSFSLFSVNNWGVIAELDKSVSQSGYVSNYKGPGVTYLELRDSVDQSESQNEQFDIGVFKSFSLKRYSMCFALFPGRIISANNSLSKSDYNTIDSISGVTLNKYNETYNSLNEIESLYNKIVFGFNHEVKESIREDLVFTINLQQNKTFHFSNNYNYRDMDPDNDGNNMYGTPITTPSYSTSSIETRNAQDPKLMSGVGVEYRLNKNLTENISKGLIFGLSWQPSETNQINTQLNQNYSLIGVSITSSTFISSSTISGNSNLYKIFITWGKNIKFPDKKLLLAYALRGDFSFNDTAKNTDLIFNYAASKSQEYTGSLGLTTGLEYGVFSSLSLRAGVSLAFVGSVKDETVSTSLLNQYQVHSKSFDQSKMLTFGLGYRPLDYLCLDIYTTGNILTLSNLQLQVKYMF